MTVEWATKTINGPGRMYLCIYLCFIVLSLPPLSPFFLSLSFCVPMYLRVYFAGKSKLYFDTQQWVKLAISWQHTHSDDECCTCHTVTATDGDTDTATDRDTFVATASALQHVLYGLLRFVVSLHFCGLMAL